MPGTAAGGSASAGPAWAAGAGWLAGLSANQQISATATPVLSPMIGKADRQPCCSISRLATIGATGAAMPVPMIVTEIARPRLAVNTRETAAHQTVVMISWFAQA